MVYRVPVAGGDDDRATLLRCRQPTIQYRRNFVTLSHRQRPARAKVDLHIDHDERISTSKTWSFHFSSHPSNSGHCASNIRSAARTETSGN
jgi:hypothetical protein